MYAAPSITFILLGDLGPIPTRRAAMTLAQGLMARDAARDELLVVQSAHLPRWVTPLAAPGLLSVHALEVDAPLHAPLRWLGPACELTRSLTSDPHAWCVVLTPDVELDAQSLETLHEAIRTAPPRTVALAPMLSRGAGVRPRVLPGRLFAARSSALHRVDWPTCQDSDPRHALWWLSAQLLAQGEIDTSLAWTAHVQPLRAALAPPREASAKQQVQQASSRELFARVQGEPEARDLLALQLAKLTSRRVALVDAGPGAKVVQTALRAAGAEIVDESAAPAGLVVATMSPSRIMASVQRRLTRRLRRDLPLLVAWTPGPRTLPRELQRAA